MAADADVHGAQETPRVAYLKNIEHQDELAHQVRFGIEYLHMDPLKVVGLFVVIPWLILLYLMEAYKVYVDGASVHYSYFTNWMLTVDIVYYTGYLIALLDYTGTLMYVWLSCVFWVFFANNIQVSLLVRIVLWSNARLMVDAQHDFGPEMALAGDWFMHVLTTGIAVAHAICIHQDLIDTLARFVLFTWRDWLFFVLYVVGEYFCAASIILGYCANFDFHHVYHVHVPFWEGLLVVAVIYFLVQTVPILFMSPLSARWRAHAYRPSTRNALVLEAIRSKDARAYDEEDEEVDVIRVI